MKPVYGILMAVALAGILCAAGCTTTETAGGETPTPVAVQDKIVLVGQNNNDDIIPVDMQTEIRITLPENPTTGYSWNVTNADGLAITSDAYVPPEEERPGAGGTHVWALEPKVTGIVTFSAVYVRPWEDAHPDDETYTITFYVAPEGTTVVDVISANNGTTISVSKGDAVLVTLDENPTTGYQWNASVSGSAEIVTDSFVPPYSEIPISGAGGIHKWLVTFDGEPSGNFDAGYGRPWEETAEDAETFSVIFAGV
ncbi:protease inhibitor I42 family protein [Methanogenium organophilum]|uniref:Protease inhibitor I42 family protein n=1 Tax=Methanogenium organophilum TaxID=2199 RepID=A0A9X9S2N4_METOG|nr:protease inhibitor I42 family protein [Methanogenium organophilum]WAI00616.1 protease inhibitor I42 family protein [Methanogenium organophilum]